MPGKMCFLLISWEHQNVRNCYNLNLKEREHSYFSSIPATHAFFWTILSSKYFPTFGLSNYHFNLIYCDSSTGCFGTERIVTILHSYRNTGARQFQLYIQLVINKVRIELCFPHFRKNAFHTCIPRYCTK